VHTDRFGAVVLCHAHLTAQAHLQPGPGAATFTKEVHDDFIVLRIEAKAILSFEIEGVFLLMCGHARSSRVYCDLGYQGNKWMLPNYIQYRLELLKQKRDAAALREREPPETEQSYESGEMADYVRRWELSEQWRALIQTRYYRRKAESLLVQLPDESDAAMFSRVDWDDHPDQPYYLTPLGLRTVRNLIRAEQKHTRETVGYWFGIAVGLIGAITGLVSAFKN